MKKYAKSALFFLLIILTLSVFSSAALAAENKQSTTLSVSNQKSGASLSWKKTDEAVSYKVYRIGEKEKKRRLITETKSTRYTDEAVKNKTKYGYSVVPVFSEGKQGKRSNEEFIIRLGRPEINGYSNTENGIRLSWTKSEGATSYRIYRRDESTGKWKRIAKTNASTFSFTDKKVTSTDSYTYMVKGCNSGSSSFRSNYLKADFLKGTTIEKITAHRKSITLNWKKVPKAVSYEIYRTDAGKNELKLYQTLSASKLSFTDKNVTKGKIYGYSIRAIDKNGKKSSLPKSSKCLLMKVPVISSAKNTTSGIKLSWSKTPSAQGYYLYRRDLEGTVWKRILMSSKCYATDTTAVNGKAYVYTVRAVYNKIQSAYDKEGFSAVFLSAPDDVKITKSGKNSNRISWDKNPSATDYNIYRRAGNNADWVRIGRTDKTSFTDKKASGTVIYSYFVRAYIKSDYKSAAGKVVTASDVNPDGKMVALTYDDGPSNTITPQILDILEKNRARATFFVVGSRITENHAPLERAVKLGCEIGNHTYGHINLPSYDKEDIVAEISKTNNLVKKYTGVIPVIARAPGGSTDSYSREAVGMPFIYWSIDTKDWETLSCSYIVSHIKSEVRDGSIILMHDLYQSTADASEIIIPWLEQQGYQLVTVSELMKYRNIRMQKGVTYYNAYP